MTHQHANIFADADVISRYTRAQAVEDGLLVDVTETASEAGIRFPVAMTRAAFEECVTWTREDWPQDESGRLWDVVWMASLAMRRSSGGDCARFAMVRVPNRTKSGRPSRSTTPSRVVLTAKIGPGDTAAPVITIMLPSES